MKYKHLQKGETNTFLIISILSATAVMGYVIYYAATNTLVGNYKDRKSGITDVIASPQPTPQYNLKKKFVTKKECVSKELSVGFNIPESWECKDTNGFLEMMSDYFTIKVSNLGRGPYCGGTPGSSIKCNINTYLSNSNYDIKLYTADEVDKEIWGQIISSSTKPKSWISITYKDIETKKLSVDKNAELIDILNSIKIK